MSFFMDVWNNFNRAALKSPLHFLTSKNTVLVTFTGRKSGETLSTPVNYAQDGNIVRITSTPERTWWRNLKANPEVELYLRGKAVRGTAEVFEDCPNVAEELEAYLCAFPHYAKFFNVRIEEDGSFNEEDLLKATEERVMIKIRVKG